MSGSEEKRRVRGIDEKKYTPIDHAKNAESVMKTPEELALSWNYTTHNFLAYVEVEWKISGYHKLWNGYYCAKKNNATDNVSNQRIFDLHKRLFQKLDDVRKETLCQRPGCTETVLCNLLSTIPKENAAETPEIISSTRLFLD